MLQALVTLLFSIVALIALGAIVQLLRNDWDMVLGALGLHRRVAPSAPLPPLVRANPARRAVMLRVEPAPQRRAAA
jgi:hypothetical protein